MEPLLAADKVMEYARDAAKQFAKSRLEMALYSAQAKSASLVQRIDRKDTYYFVVSFAVGARETGRIIVDAFSGKLQEASGVVDAHQSLESYLSSTDALDRMLAARQTSTIKKWDFEFRRETIGMHPVLVWKPCRQSHSPFLPFHQFSVGGSFVYLRVDGQLFTELKAGKA